MQLALVTAGLSPALGAPPPPTSPEPRQGQLLQLKQQRAESLRRLLEADQLPGRGDRLFELARLQLELAILGEAAPGSAELEVPALTCRRLLLEEPAYPRLAEVKIFLVRLELRRGRTEAALTLTRELLAHASTAVRCQARLLAGEAWSAANRPGEAAGSYAAALTGLCRGADRQQARYRLAWAQLAARRFSDAARELRILLDQALPARLRARVLSDLILCWSHGEPPAGAAALLLDQAGPQRGGRLLHALGRGLLEAGRWQPLLRLTGSLPAGLALEDRLGLLGFRLRGLAGSGAATALENEIVSLAPLAAQLSSQISAARLELAGALERSSSLAQRQQAELLYEKVGVGRDAGSQRARLRLGVLRAARGDLDGAVGALEAACREPGPARESASYHLLGVLERRLAATPPGQKAAARERLARAAWRHAGEHPAAAGTAEVLLLLARLESGRRAHLAAARAAQRLLVSFPAHPKRPEAVELAAAALEEAGEWERLDELATAEARQPDLSPAAATRWRRVAAGAALQRCRELAGRGDLAGAARFAQRALSLADDPDLKDESRLAAALVATRQQRLEEATRLTGILADGHGKLRGRAQLLLGELKEAGGSFAAAAEAYAAAAAQAPSPAQRLELWRRQAGAHLAAGQRPAARAVLVEMNRCLDRQVVPDQLGWRLRLGRLWERARGPAVNYHLRLAEQLERQQPRAAARVLLRAASQLPTARARPLLERARQLAGSLRGRGAAQAGRATLQLVRLERQRLLRIGARRGAAGHRQALLGLQQLLPGLVEVLAAPDRRLAADAGLEIAEVYQALAVSLPGALAPPELDQQNHRALMRDRVAALLGSRQQVLERVARLAREETGLHESSLQAARLLADPGISRLEPTALPPGHPAVSAALEQLRRGQPAAAALAASRALGLLGDRDDLLCVRGLARLRSGRPGAARRDLSRALETNPASQCARLNLLTLALWTADPVAAQLLDGLPALERKRFAALLQQSPEGPAPLRASALPLPGAAGVPELEEPGLEHPH